jgi:quercetin dioxygenase-like cupin family protein
MSNQNIIKTENVLVRIMELEKDASSEWHYHTEVTDYFVCLNGSIKVVTKNPDSALIMLPGHRVEVKPYQVHRVVNISSSKSEYLLVQGVGTYDFIKV